jgi:hypothetical protein
MPLKGQHSITFVHLGRKYYQITLWANTYFTQKKWIGQIAKEQEALRERSLIFDTVTFSEGFFNGPNKVNCAAPFRTWSFFRLWCARSDRDVDHGRRVVYGTDDGVYLSDLRGQRTEPMKVLTLMDVSQVDVLEDYQLLIVLSGKRLLLVGDLSHSFTRATSDHVPSGGVGPRRSNGWPQASKENIKPYGLLQSRHLSRASARLHRQIQSALEYDQNLGANRPERTREEQANV